MHRYELLPGAQAHPLLNRQISAVIIGSDETLAKGMSLKKLRASK